jgi:outer membrane protein OmpA-like peptidoglycan-associated protein
MKKTIVISSLIAATLSYTSQSYAEATKEENIGVASGAIVGAAAAGPVGFILGAAFGGLIGGEVHKAGQVDQLKQELHQAEYHQQQLTTELTKLKQQVSLNPKTELKGSEMLQMDLLFHTAATELDDNDRKRVSQLADFLNRYPMLTVKLDGFADPRGSAEQNLVLSEQRIEAVKRLLVEHGIDETRIFTAAHGESQSVAPAGNFDAYALERRVSIRFIPQEEQSLASNQ